MQFQLLSPTTTSTLTTTSTATLTSPTTPMASIADLASTADLASVANLASTSNLASTAPLASTATLVATPMADSHSTVGPVSTKKKGRKRKVKKTNQNKKNKQQLINSNNTDNIGSSTNSINNSETVKHIASGSGNGKKIKRKIKKQLVIGNTNNITSAPFVQLANNNPITTNNLMMMTTINDKNVAIESSHQAASKASGTNLTHPKRKRKLRRTTTVEPVSLGPTYLEPIYLEPLTLEPVPPQSPVLSPSTVLPPKSISQETIPPLRSAPMGPIALGTIPQRPLSLETASLTTTALETTPPRPVLQEPLKTLIAPGTISPRPVSLGTASTGKVPIKPVSLEPVHVKQSISQGTVTPKPIPIETIPTRPASMEPVPLGLVPLDLMPPSTFNSIPTISVMEPINLSIGTSSTTTTTTSTTTTTTTTRAPVIDKITKTTTILSDGAGKKLTTNGQLMDNLQTDPMKTEPYIVTNLPLDNSQTYPTYPYLLQNNEDQIVMDNSTSFVIDTNDIIFNTGLNNSSLSTIYPSVDPTNSIATANANNTAGSNKQLAKNNITSTIDSNMTSNIDTNIKEITNEENLIFLDVQNTDLIGSNNNLETIVPHGGQHPLTGGPVMNNNNSYYEVTSNTTQSHNNTVSVKLDDEHNKIITERNNSVAYTVQENNVTKNVTDHSTDVKNVTTTTTTTTNTTTTTISDNDGSITGSSTSSKKDNSNIGENNGKIGALKSTDPTSTVTTQIEHPQEPPGPDRANEVIISPAILSYPSSEPSDESKKTKVSNAEPLGSPSLSSNGSFVKSSNISPGINYNFLPPFKVLPIAGVSINKFPTPPPITSLQMPEVAKSEMNDRVRNGVIDFQQLIERQQQMMKNQGRRHPVHYATLDRGDSNYMNDIYSPAKYLNGIDSFQQVTGIGSEKNGDIFTNYLKDNTNEIFQKTATRDSFNELIRQRINQRFMSGHRSRNV